MEALRKKSNTTDFTDLRISSSLLQEDQKARAIKYIDRNPFLSCLPEGYKKEFVACLNYKKISAGELVWEMMPTKSQEDFRSCNFMIVDFGKLKVKHQKEKMDFFVMKEQSFGEFQILSKRINFTGIEGIQDTTIFYTNSFKFLEAIQKQEKPDIAKFLKLNNVFGGIIQDEKINELSKSGICLRIKDQKSLVNRGEFSHFLYLIESGAITLEQNGKTITLNTKGDWIGEESLKVPTSLSSFSALGKENSKFILFHADIVLQCLGSTLCEQLIFRNKQKLIYKTFGLFETMESHTINKLVSIMELKKDFTEGEIIANQDNPQMILVLSGSVIDERSDTVYEEGSIVGETFLQNTSNGVEIRMKKEGVVSLVSRAKFLQEFGTLLEAIVNAENKIKEAYQNKEISASVILKNGIENYRVVKHLGQGQYGKVFVVESCNNPGKFFAVKCFSKYKVFAEDIIDILRNEKEIMQEISHPFICQFYKCLDDQYFLYFFIEYIEGYDLYEFLTHNFTDVKLQNKEKEEHIRFIAAQIILAIEYLHSHNIAHRDLKPQNIMMLTGVENRGYIKLVDFGHAHRFSEKPKTYTMAGTIFFMAPEILGNKGFNALVDLWALGVTLFFMFTSDYPYGVNLDLAAEFQKQISILTQQIHSKEISFPSGISDNFKALILQLLSKEAISRLGGSRTNLKYHAWFEKFKWSTLSNKTMKAPFVPFVPKESNDSYLKNKVSISEYALQIHCGEPYNEGEDDEEYDDEVFDSIVN